VRHTDARRLAQSGADEDDRPVPGELRELAGNLVRRDADGTAEPELLVIVPANVDEKRSLRDQLARLIRVDPE
jgi:hypothetical protein